MSYFLRYFQPELAKAQEIFKSLKDYSVSDVLLAQVIRAELSNLRSGNAHTKMRGEVRGGGKKPWRQKGTGRARHGSSRSPIWVGGGVTFGPRNTVNWHLRINKTARIAALKSILKSKAEEKAALIIEEKADYSKTSSTSLVFNEVVEKLSAKAHNFALVYTTEEKDQTKGFCNLGVKLINAKNLKLYQLAAAKYLIFTPKAVQEIELKIEK